MEGADPGPAPLTERESEPPDWAQIEPPDYDEQPDDDEPPVAEAPLDVAVVDVAVVDDAEPTESPDAVVEEPEAVVDDALPEPRSSLLVPVLLGLVLLALLVAIGGLVVSARNARSHDDARQAALQAARQQAVNLTTISYETADADLGRIISSATGTLRTQFEAQRAQFPAVLAKDKSVSVGTVLAAGVASQSAGTVEALVAVDAAVSNAQTAKAGGQPLVKHYRMDMKLVLVGGRWLVSQVAFAGLPQ